MMTTLPLSGLGLAAGGGLLGQDTEDILTLSPPDTLVDGAVTVPETVAVCNSVLCPVMTCVYIAETGGETSCSGSDRNTSEGRH